VVPVPPSLPAAVAAAGAPPPSTCSSSVDDVVSASSSYDEVEHQQPQHPPLRNDMTITGKLNAEEDTIFLKVQIADEASGHARNIYFPFDMASDTAAEVAQEMVKELDITDRDASEIAAMIQQEIGRLLPGRAQQQHEYTYAERDDNENDRSAATSPRLPPPHMALTAGWGLTPPEASLAHVAVAGPKVTSWLQIPFYKLIFSFFLKSYKLNLND
jgi:WNK lysine deficient protein kinase